MIDAGESKRKVKRKGEAIWEKCEAKVRVS